MRIQDMDYVPEKKNYVSEPFLYIILCFMYVQYVLGKNLKILHIYRFAYGCDISDCDRQEKCFVRDTTQKKEI